MRVFAALAVLVHHAREMWPQYPAVRFIGEIGWLGVPFFFSLSGFVLMWGTNLEIPEKIFIWKRLVRIYPLHFATLLFSLLFFAAFNKPVGGYVGNPLGTVANFLLIHDWLPGHPEVRQAWNGVSWTLSCEFFFYLAALRIFRWIQKTELKTLWWTIGSLWLIEFLTVYSANRLDWPALSDFMLFHPLPRIVEFCAGAVGAKQVLQWMRDKRPVKDGAWMTVIGISLLPIASYCSTQTSYSGLILYLISPSFLLMIVFLAFSEASGDSLIIRTFSSPLLIFLGEASFALYITHTLVLFVYGYCVAKHGPAITTPFRGEVAMLGAAVTCLTISGIIYRYFELPLRGWLLSHRPKLIQSGSSAS